LRHSAVYAILVGMYLRKISRKNRDGSTVTYLQLAHNQRDPLSGVVKAQVLHSFGRADELDADALRRLAHSLLRYADPASLERLRAEEASGAAGLQVVSSRRYGGLHALQCLWEALSLPRILASVVPGAPPWFEHAVFAIVANRALAPTSKLGLFERWLETVHLPGRAAEGLRLEQLYRALDLLAEHKEKVERALFFEVADLLSVDVDLIFYDTTSVYVEREEEDPGEEALRKWGHSKDSRPDAPQVVVGLAVTRDGLPVKSWVWPGNTTDVTTIEQVKRDLSGWRLGPVVYVADGGMMSEENLSVLSRGGTGYILGVPLRRSKEAAAVLSRPGRFQAVAENLEIKEVAYPAEADVPVASKRRRYLVCRNPEEARRQKHRREEALKEIQAELDRLRSEHPKKACELLTSRRFSRYLKTGRKGRPVLDREAIAREEKLDGKWLLVTNDRSLSAEDIALGYKRLLRVEASFRRLKHGIDVRPLYHRRDERIQAHVFACVLALLLERVAELRTGETWPRIRHELEKIQVVLLESHSHAIVQTTKPSPASLKFLSQMQIAAPKQILHLEKNAKSHS
jgi:transposase